MSNNIPELEFGCEFEFYVNANIEEELIEELKSISKVELVIIIIVVKILTTR